MPRDENLEMKTEPLDTDFSANSEVSKFSACLMYFLSRMVLFLNERFSM